MTNVEAIKILRDMGGCCSSDNEYIACDMAIAALEKQEGKKPIAVETNIYDQEEIYHNCTVQVLRNSVTGDVSRLRWWKEGKND